MKKVAIIIILILAVCTVQAEDNRRIRFTSSGLFFGKYSYRSTNIIFLSETTIIKTKFPILYSLGVELEFTTKNSFVKGIGFNAIPLAEQITEGIFDDSDEIKHKLNEIYTLYLYSENIDPLGRSNLYGRLNYGTGIPYLFYGAFGAGYNINKKWNVEVTLNGHYTTFFWVSSSIKYLNVKFGYSF